MTKFANFGINLFNEKLLVGTSLHTNHIIFVIHIFDVLRFIDEADDYRSASSLWKQMQEEDCPPSNEFLILLTEIMSRHKISIPFEILKENDSATDGMIFFTQCQHDYSRIAWKLFLWLP